MIEKTHPETERKERPSFPADRNLQAELRLFREKSGWTNVEIASQVGYNNAVVSDYLHSSGENKYSGDIKKFERRVREFLRDQRLELDSGVTTIDCEISEQIDSYLEEIRTAKRIGVIIGVPGIGKTRGISVYCKNHDLAILFSASIFECNLSSAIDCLFAAADVARSKKGFNQAKTLAKKLEGSGRLIIVDDAHKLTRAALQFFYDLRDKTGQPVALFGDSRLVEKLQDDPQRLRRTGAKYTLRSKNPDPLIEHHIRQIIPDIEGEFAPLLKLCRQIAAKDGAFGSVQMELAMAVRLKRSQTELSWCEAVKRAHSRLIRNYALEVA